MFSVHHNHCYHSVGILLSPQPLQHRLAAGAFPRQTEESHDQVQEQVFRPPPTGGVLLQQQGHQAPPQPPLLQPGHSRPSQVPRYHGPDLQ